MIILVREQRDDVASILNDGGVVALPTDTVYGLAARLDRPTAVAALFAIKERPETVALPVFVRGVDDVNAIGGRLTPSARTLTHAFWPGALTVIVPCLSELARLVGSTTATVGVRCPNDDAVQELLALTGPLVVTSANEHGAPPCTSATAVVDTLGGRASLAAVWDGGIRDGAVSTVVRCEEQGYAVVRHGALSAEQLQNAFR